MWVDLKLQMEGERMKDKIGIILDHHKDKIENVKICQDAMQKHKE